MTVLQHIGLLGWPLGHSISPPIHNAAFAALGLNWRYELLAVPPERLMETVQRLISHGWRGANVTIPYKQAVMPLMDELSDAARLIGAVNTIIVQTDGTLRGDNTDWLGFLYPLDEQGFVLAGRQMLLLGAGGAARAVAYALAQRDVARIAIWNRSRQRAEALTQHLRTHFPGLAVSAGTDLAVSSDPGVDLIVNTTPVGMWPNVDASPWPDTLPFPSNALVYDLVYRPERTLLLRQAAAAGCSTQGGLEMLVVQAAASWQMWTGQKPPLAVMMTAARQTLGANRGGYGRSLTGS